MKPMPTLKERVSQISIGAFIIITVLMFTSFTLYSMKKTKITEEGIQNDLTLNLKNQINLFLPSFLVPEQKQGVDLMLERIKRDENLEDALIIKNVEELPAAFSKCQLSNSHFVTCPSLDMSATAIVAPLNEMDQHFGFLLKSKSNSSPASLKNILQLAGIILLILGLAFISIYIFVTRLMSRTLPIALNNLVKWIESEVHGKDSDQIELHFKELEDLKGKISEVLDRYNRSRDQAVIGQLTSGIMHDIKTPLQSIVTAIHLVDEQAINSPKRESRLENLFIMCKNSMPLIGNIIETTLDGSRQIQIQKDSGNLRSTVDESIRYTKELSRLRNVIVEVDAPEEIRIQYDSFQFVRVMNNLIKNGIEAASESSKSSGRVKVSIKNIDHDRIKLTVEDSGQGFTIPPEKIFGAFRTTKVRGTGLGLLITKKIVEAHEGQIEASNSSSFGGARMEVILPVGEIVLS